MHIYEPSSVKLWLEAFVEKDLSFDEPSSIEVKPPRRAIKSCVMGPIKDLAEPLPAYINPVIRRQTRGRLGYAYL